MRPGPHHAIPNPSGIRSSAAIRPSTEAVIQLQRMEHETTIRRRRLRDLIAEVERNEAGVLDLILNFRFGNSLEAAVVADRAIHIMPYDPKSGIAPAPILPFVAPFPESRMDEDQLRTLELALLVDCTPSMKPVIAALQSQMGKALAHLLGMCPGIGRVRCAFVGYRDFDAPARYSVADFSPYEEIEGWMRENAHTVIGARPDTCEDVLGGIYHVSKLSWSSKYRLVLHFGDAPGHGNRLHDFNFTDCDHFRETQPPEHGADRVEEYLLRLRALGAHIVFFQLGNIKWTEKMRRLFASIYGEGVPAPMYRGVFMGETTSDVMERVFLRSVVDEMRQQLSVMGLPAA
ncbi:hypothetical protein HK101_001919 [Irineochytrium annulatum]|nr:hypothetical protein HK101_001919 [Irineochytrium annulatum]